VLPGSSKPAPQQTGILLDMSFSTYVRYKDRCVLPSFDKKHLTAPSPLA
jgi:hypothetical protein